MVVRSCKEKECLAYAKLYDIEAVCLRYFNVYGPNQRFDAYGNVIPIFAFKMLRGEVLTIFGDGEQTRDFVNVHDVVQANIKAAHAGIRGLQQERGRITINTLVKLLREASGIEPKVVHGPPRPGDVRDSLADISAARAFGFEPTSPSGGTQGIHGLGQIGGEAFLKILVLGGEGMLGHKIVQTLSSRYPDTTCTSRTYVGRAYLSEGRPVP
jgi:nucleoside-diphosphate-sugar epimerase